MPSILFLFSVDFFIPWHQRSLRLRFGRSILYLANKESRKPCTFLFLLDLCEDKVLLSMREPWYFLRLASLDLVETLRFHLLERRLDLWWVQRHRIRQPFVVNGEENEPNAFDEQPIRCVHCNQFGTMLSRSLLSKERNDFLPSLQMLESTAEVDGQNCMHVHMRHFP